MSKTEDSITTGVRDLLAADEEVLSALVVSPRGSQTAMAMGVAGEIGRRWSNKNRDGAEHVGLVVKRSSGLVLTSRRVLTVDLSISAMGGVKSVNGLLSELPLDVVDEARSKWNVLTLKAGGAEFKLECKPPAAKAFAHAFDSARAAV